MIDGVVQQERVLLNEAVIMVDWLVGIAGSFGLVRWREEREEREIRRESPARHSWLRQQLGIAYFLDQSAAISIQYAYSTYKVYF